MSALRPASAAQACLQALGLQRAPFPSAPDAESYFLDDARERDLAEALHCLLARKGFVLVTGEVGRGKTTFLRRLVTLAQDEGAAVSLVFNTFLQGPELLAAVLRDFGLRPAGNAADDIDRLNRFLVRKWQEGVTCALVVDDAQNLTPDSLELVRLLSNLESGREKLLQIVLAGQPELEATLARHGMRQLASRVIKHMRLEDLSRGDTARYVAFRLRRAGDEGAIALTPAALAALYRRSRGNPRRIHLIMDRCLYGLVARGTRRIDRALVVQAAAEAGFSARPRRWRLTAAVAALVTTAAAAVGLQGGRRHEPVVAVAPAARAPTAPARAACALEPADGAPLSAFAAPTGALAHLAPRADLCIERHGDTTAVVWRAPPAPDLAARTPQPALRRLQQALWQSGAFADGDLRDPRDGLWGERTRAAIARFQAWHGLPADGLPDPLTRLLLEDALARVAPARPASERPHGRR